MIINKSAEIQLEDKALLPAKYGWQIIMQNLRNFNRTFLTNQGLLQEKLLQKVKM